MKEKMYIQNFTNEKFKEIFYFFICMLPDYMAHDITKKIWKKRHFENMTAGFPLRYQK